MGTTVTAALIKDLRERTQAPMGLCREALTESNGDMDAAIDYIAKKSGITATRRGSRIATEGRVVSYAEGPLGAILELNCESDFVANTLQFRTLAMGLCVHVALHNPADVAELLAMPYNDDGTVGDLIATNIAKTGENIVIRRFTRFELGA